jgi:hypothetical protein
MRDQPKAAPNAAEDLKDERAILVYVVETFPQTMLLSDLGGIDETIGERLAPGR